MRYLVLVWIAFLCMFQSGEIPTSQLCQQAQQDLYAARYQSAAELYARVLKQDPAYYDAYYGLVLSLLRTHRAKEAYAVADDALLKNPESPIVQTAAGLAAWRHGDLSAAEEYFRTALRNKPGYPGALKGLSSVYAVVSQFKSALELLTEAYHSWPEDPYLMISHANTLKGVEHISALEKILAALDPESELARSLEAHISPRIEQ